MRLLRIAHASCLGLATSLCACGGAPAAHSSADADLVLVADEVRPALLGHPALEMLPPGTEVVVVVRDLHSLAEALQYDELRSKYAALIEPAAAEVIQELGENLLTEDGFRRIGLDPSQPWGFAWLDSHDEAGCVFAKLEDPAAFKGWFYRFGALQGFKVTETVGDATLLRFEEEGEIVGVLAGGYAFMVFGDGSRDDVFKHARSIPSGGNNLAQTSTFKRLRAREVPGDVAVYLATPLLLERLGVPRIGARAVPVLGDIDGAVLSATLAPRKIELRGFVGVDSERLLSRALRAGGLSPVFTVDVGPSVAGAAHLEPGELTDAFDAVVSLDEDPAKVRKKIQRETGLDLDTEVFPALSGDVGFIHRRRSPDGPDDYPHSRVTVMFGLSDVARGKQIASKLAARNRSNPEFRVVGDQLIVSDDKGAVRQLSKDSSLFTPKNLALPDDLFSSAAITLRIDAEAVAREIFGFDYGSSSAESALAVPADAGTSDADSPEIRSIRRKVQELEKRRQALRKTLDQIHDRRRKADGEDHRGMANALGTTAVSFRPVRGGFEMLGGQFIRESDGAALLDRLLGTVVAMEKRRDAMRSQSDALYEQLAGLDGELDVLRGALRNAQQGLEGSGVAKPIR